MVLITIQQPVRSVRQGCAAVVNTNGRHARYYVTFIIWVLVLAALSLP